MLGQLLEALELQDYRNLKFGTLAVRSGYLTEDQVEQINEHQRQVDKPFGDLAVEMNLMTAAQVEEVLTFQKNNYLFLGDAESLHHIAHLWIDPEHPAPAGPGADADLLLDIGGILRQRDNL